VQQNVTVESSATRNVEPPCEDYAAREINETVFRTRIRARTEYAHRCRGRPNKQAGVRMICTSLHTVAADTALVSLAARRGAAGTYGLCVQKSVVAPERIHLTVFVAWRLPKRDILSNTDCHGGPACPKP
jgi:hypothetical protein